MPPLVTTSPVGTPLAQAGVLGFNSTTTLFGADPIVAGVEPGGRLTVGRWLDECEHRAVEGRLFALGRETARFQAQSADVPILARPFTNINPDIGPVGPVARILGYPLIATDGMVSIVSDSEVFSGDATFRQCLIDDCYLRLDLLSGYQFSRINEGLSIADSVTDINNNNLIVNGTRQEIIDVFDTHNEFHGGQLGLEGAYSAGCWQMVTTARVAVGNMRQDVTISGTTTTDVPNDPNSPTVLSTGLLANASNQGQHLRNTFAVATEAKASVVYTVSDCLDLSVAYSLNYWSDVAQPGAQIDPMLNVPAQFAVRDNQYWVHAVNIGASMQF